MPRSRDFPDRTVPPPSGDGEASGTFVLPHGHIVALVVADEATRTEILDVLRQGPYGLGGSDLTETAGVVIADVVTVGRGTVAALTAAVEARVRDLRRAARADAAIILVLDQEWPADVSTAAEAAGAFACMRRPLVPEGVEAVVKSASATYAAQTRIADLTRQLDLQSHLKSLARFTGGLHHELKNPLAVVEMNVNLVRDELETLFGAREHLRALAFAPVAERAERQRAAREFLDATESNTGDLQAAVDDARTSLERMRRLFQRLQNFVRQEETPSENVDLQALVAEVREQAAPALEGVDVEVVVAEEPLYAIAVRPLVLEILLNLASNAAIAARSLSSPRVRFHAYASGDRVVVSVRDNGPGIAQEAQEKIFDPFYTTRRAEGAAGLGLAICREYAAHMGAELSFWTAPGRGACFRLHLRRV